MLLGQSSSSSAEDRPCERCSEEASRASFRSGLSEGTLKTFLEDAKYEYVPLQRFKLGHWGLLIALGELCSDCFHLFVFLFEGI